MKLKDIKGLLGNKKYDPTKFSSEPLYPDDCEIESIKGYNQAREEDEEREIELDVNKVSDIIQTGVKMLILNELSPYSFDGAIEEIIKSLVPADIIKVKGEK